MSDFAENTGKKVLILGEYSSFSRNLKAGLKEYGCEVTVYTTGDSFKQIEHDSDDLYVKTKDLYFSGFRLRGTWRLRGLINNLKVKRYKKKNRDSLDLVLIINPDFIHTRNIFMGTFDLEDCRKLLKSSGKLFMSACGVDIAYLRYGNKMRYWPFSDYDSQGIKALAGKLDEGLFKRLISCVDGVIPVMFDYAFVYRELARDTNVPLLPTIPLPIETKDIRYTPNVAHGRIIIFHGKSRDVSKGSEIIIQAINRLQARYPEKVELLLPDRLPFYEYLETMSHANIVVDQCRSYSYAMNALYALSMGKVVLSGNEPECSEEFGIEIPVINILPDINDIEMKLMRFIDDPLLLQYYGQSGRKFVDQFHGSHIVAKKYLSLLSDNQDQG
jgi:glycosyltransferase involved in cell wall biosynthesis